MELSGYIKLLRRWWWVIVIVGILSSSSAYIISRTQDPQYEAEVKLFTGGFIQDPNPVVGEIQTGTDLATTYANLVTVRPTLNNVIEELDLDTTPDELGENITTRIVPETSILVITVRDKSRVQSANIANGLADELIHTSPTSLTPEQEERRSLIEEQITFLFVQIDDSRQLLVDVESQLLNSESSPEEEAQLITRRDELLTQISSWQQNIADLSDTLNAIATQTNRLTVVEPAVIPEDPVAPNVARNVLLVTFIGVFLAIGFIILFEYLDDTIHNAEELRAQTNLPVFATIAKFGTKKEKYKDRLVMLSAPNSAVAEGYRALRTNLLFGYETNPISRLIVTSARPGEGKTVTSSNLAVALARSEYKTVVIDADLHRPRVHDVFDLKNELGLGNIFDLPLQPNHLLPVDFLAELLQPTELENLKVITSGVLPSTPAELFGLAHVKVLCQSLEKHFGVNMIVFDTPPILSLVDSLPLASNIGASVILVVAANSTRREQVKLTLERFEHVGANVLGSVINGVKRQSDAYYYYYDYGYNASRTKS